MGEGNRRGSSMTEWDHERAAFYVALAVLLGSFILLGIFAVARDTSGMISAGAIVGVWVGAVVTFYFTRIQVQNARKAGAKAGQDAFLASVQATNMLQEEVRGQKEIGEKLAEQLKEQIRAGNEARQQKEMAEKEAERLKEQIRTGKEAQEQKEAAEREAERLKEQNREGKSHESPGLPGEGRAGE